MVDCATQRDRYPADAESAAAESRSWAVKRDHCNAWGAESTPRRRAVNHGTRCSSEAPSLKQAAIRRRGSVPSLVSLGKHDSRALPCTRADYSAAGLRLSAWDERPRERGLAAKLEGLKTFRIVWDAPLKHCLSLVVGVLFVGWSSEYLTQRTCRTDLAPLGQVLGGCLASKWCLAVFTALTLTCAVAYLNTLMQPFMMTHRQAVFCVLFILSAGLHLVSAPVWMAAKQMRARDVVYLGQSYVTHLALFFLTPGMARPAWIVVLTFLAVSVLTDTSTALGAWAGGASIASLTAALAFNVVNTWLLSPFWAFLWHPPSYDAIEAHRVAAAEVTDANATWLERVLWDYHVRLFDFFVNGDLVSGTAFATSFVAYAVGALCLIGGSQIALGPLTVLLGGLLMFANAQLSSSIRLATREEVIADLVPREVADALIQDRLARRMATWQDAVQHGNGGARHATGPAVARASPANAVEEVLGALAVHDDRLIYFKWYESISVVCADVAGFTALSDSLDAGEVLGMLHTFFSTLDRLVARERATKYATVGDGYIVCTNMTTRDPAHALTALRIAVGVASAATTVPVPRSNGRHLAVRVGIHTGPSAAGVIGRMRNVLTLLGKTMYLAGQMEQTSRPGHVRITAQTLALLPPEVQRCFARESVVVKRRDGPAEVDSYFADCLRSADLRRQLGYEEHLSLTLRD